MKTKGDQPIRFAVLIPHRDTGVLIRPYRRSLFAAGLAGAWSFPDAVPLARLPKPLSADELKTLALALRDLSLEDGRKGWFRSAGVAVETLPGFAGFYGPLLDIPAPQARLFPAEKLLYCFPRLVLGAALIGDTPPAQLPEVPAISFRAAAVSNLILRPLSSGDEQFSFSWKFGKPVWLPPVRLHKTKEVS
ncbi:hypothetical protein FACS1894147_12920 [Spirochaetia bacterium]|nr:hypothetical protein FACS1894147_12920 [Spirochaetia bacterium]